MGSTGRGRSAIRSNSAHRTGAGLVVAATLVATACSVHVDGSPTVSMTTPPPTVILSVTPNQPSTETLATVLARALVQEGSAQATHDNVIAKFGQVAPFTQFAKDAADNVSALNAVAKAHGITISGEPVEGSPAAPTLALACWAGAELEKYSIAVYDELLPQATNHPDVTAVLTNLRSAATDTHLPAMQRCS